MSSDCKPLFTSPENIFLDLSKITDNNFKQLVNNVIAWFIEEPEAMRNNKLKLDLLNTPILGSYNNFINAVVSGTTAHAWKLFFKLILEQNKQINKIEFHIYDMINHIPYIMSLHNNIFIIYKGNNYDSRYFSELTLCQILNVKYNIYSDFYDIDLFYDYIHENEKKYINPNYLIDEEYYMPIRWVFDINKYRANYNNISFDKYISV